MWPSLLRGARWRVDPAKICEKENCGINSFSLNDPLYRGKSAFYLLIDNPSFGNLALVSASFPKKLLSVVNVVDTSDRKKWRHCGERADRAER